MPDWSYHPLLRPASRLVPPDAIRPFVLNALALIARLPGGGTFIELLGNMNAPQSIRRRALGMDITSPVGLASGVDPDGVALEAFARFGFGVIEVGPDVPVKHPPRGVKVLVRTPVDDSRIARGTMSSPREVLAALSSGAELVLLDSGFVEGGPGLPKRINEAIAGHLAEGGASTVTPAWRQGWPWIALLGAGMAIAGLAVLAVGLTTVTLPYDESFLGLSHSAIAALNPRLISFMKHDRVTLAGTMISLGLLYAGLALGGMRNGAAWARRTVIASGTVGFASLFLFLGFRYVDPLHVALAVVLFPPYLAGVLLPTPEQWRPSSDLDNDTVWRAGLWGQLYFVALGAGLVVAGVIIAAVGVTGVFVWSDLQFLGTTSEALSRANLHLLPLIAHDRAGFGGALASDGVGVMLLGLWGFHRGERWVWWTLLLGGSAGFLGGVYAHVAVGYLEFGHLLPVTISGAVFLAGLLLSAPYLLDARRKGARLRHVVAAPAAGR
ncbi:MAG TPA: hypothetical protein VJT78_06700 [Candidatus Dormibacteraeota bacterium]|nr:hypothetical protein [Candidatus Dormibacteraeota bacterium]